MSRVALDSSDYGSSDYRANRHYRTSLARLQGVQKSGAGEPAYLRWVNRPLGARAAAIAYRLGLSPNQVTAISGVLSLGGLVAIAIGGTRPVVAVTATALLLLGFALDSADGQLARLAGAGSRSGEWLDHVVDSVRLPLAHLAIAICLFFAGAPLWSVGASLAFSLVASVWFFAATLASQLLTQQDSREADAASGAPAWVSFAKLPFDTAALFFLVLLLPWLPVFLTGYAALLVLTITAALIALRRKFTSLRRETV